MRVLLIGGNGFIGSHIQDALIARGHSVRVLDTSPERYRARLAGTEFTQGSSDQPFALAAALEDIDAVVYLASTTTPATSNADVAGDIRTNLVPLAATLNAMRDANHKRIVYFSSGGTVYGAVGTKPVNEAQPLDPVCSYGIVKVAAEKYLGMYRHLHGMMPLILRPSNPFGPRQGHQGAQGFIAASLERMREGLTIEVWGDGTVIRDYIYVEDVALAVALGVESGVSDVLNIGSGTGRSLSDVLTSLRDVTGVTPDVRHSPARMFDIPHLVLSTARAENALGWKPITAFEDGVAAHWRWLADTQE